MIVNALKELPGQKGSKKEVFRKIEQLYNISLQAKSSS